MAQFMKNDRRFGWCFERLPYHNSSSEEVIPLRPSRQHGENGKRFTIGIFLGEDPNNFESAQALVGRAIILFRFSLFAVDTGSQNCNSLCSFDDMASQLAPGLEAGNP